MQRVVGKDGTGSGWMFIQSRSAYLLSRSCNLDFVVSINYQFSFFCRSFFLQKLFSFPRRNR